jgi:GAF domain-containing protein
MAREEPAGPLTPPSTRPRGVDAMLRMLLGEMPGDLALLTEIVGEEEIIRTAISPAGADAPEAGESAPLEDTICRRLLEGRIGPVIPDVASDAAVRGVPVVRQFGIGAYVGVPVTPADGRLFVLCWIAHEARPELGARELRVCEGVAASVAASLDAAD